MSNDTLRAQTIELMTGFMMDNIYAGQNIDTTELQNTAALYYDLVLGARDAIAAENVIKEKQAVDAVKAGYVDASNPTQVDLMGGARAVEKSTFYKGE